MCRYAMSVVGVCVCGVYTVQLHKPPSSLKKKKKPLLSIFVYFRLFPCVGKMHACGGAWEYVV
eukprot:NODE_1703_length_503_cov_51.731278_g1625_i0.p3 GENE.NODE_1703_length_503_cov_51.731278_g1625_i0~~NODE_1703_length_503_cov_51.731278_g1625_i0.p3  ORF type:complete len:63 (-),score=15.49 NODE_1703_length_503_cov_51.731278_g1625_i0:248-436(-)